MGLGHGAKITTDNLVFYYDQGNDKSFVGPAIQNLAAMLVFNNSSGTGVSIVGGTETVDIPQIGSTSVVFNNIQNNYTSFSPNSTACCPSPFTFGNGIVVSPSTLYTYGIVYKVDSGYTHPNFMYRYEFTSNGGTYLTEGGVHNNSNRIHLGDGWYWAWGTFTTQTTTNWLGYHGAFYYRYSNTVDKMSVARVLIAPGNFTALHPKYWPSVNTTRSTSQVLRDLTSINTVTATSLTYANNGTFSFNGTNNFISTSYNGTSPAFTHEVFLRPTDVSKDQMYIGYEPITAQYVRIVNSQAFLSVVATGGQLTHTHPQVLANNTNYHIVSCYNGVQLKIYVNGVLSSGSVINQALSAWGIDRIGRWRDADQRSFVGTIFNLKTYNRELSAA